AAAEDLTREFEHHPARPERAAERRTCLVLVGHRVYRHVGQLAPPTPVATLGGPPSPFNPLARSHAAYGDPYAHDRASGVNALGAGRIRRGVAVCTTTTPDHDLPPERLRPAQPRTGQTGSQSDRPRRAPASRSSCCPTP